MLANSKLCKPGTLLRSPLSQAVSVEPKLDRWPWLAEAREAQRRRGSRFPSTINRDCLAATVWAANERYSTVRCCSANTENDVWCPPRRPGGREPHQIAGAERIASRPCSVNLTRAGSTVSSRLRAGHRGQPAWTNTRCSSPRSRAAGVMMVRSPMTILRPCRMACRTSSSHTKSDVFCTVAAGAVWDAGGWTGGLDATAAGTLAAGSGLGTDASGGV